MYLFVSKSLGGGFRVGTGVRVGGGPYARPLPALLVFLAIALSPVVVYVFFSLLYWIRCL